MPTALQDIQTALSVSEDDVWGLETQAALNTLQNASDRVGLATPIGDVAIRQAYLRCRKRGSHIACERTNDDQVGVWGDNLAQNTVAMCALTPEDIITKFGTVEAGKHAVVTVIIPDGESTIEVDCILADVLDNRSAITDGTVIKLNPKAQAGLGFEDGFSEEVTWIWA